MKEYLPPWPLVEGGEQKVFFETTHRGVSPEGTLANFASYREAAGITRLADVTYLDCVGIPVYVAVRPLLEHPDLAISVYNGKGLTKNQAKASAMMEAFERFAAERWGRPTQRATLAELRAQKIPALDPNEMIVPADSTYFPEEAIEWVQGFEIQEEKPVLVPAAFVFFPYLPAKGCRTFDGCLNTNGLASGNTFGEAICHGLSEAVERDAESLAEAMGRARKVALETFPSPKIWELARRFEGAGIHLVVKEITSDAGVPTFFAATDDPVTQDPLLLCRGVGTHLSPEIAMMRAITEAAQSRCTIIGGAREDLEREEGRRTVDYREMKSRMGYWYESGTEPCDMSGMEDGSSDNFSEDLRRLQGHLSRIGLNKIFVVNLTRREVPVPVVRVLVPGLEQTVINAARRGARFDLAASQGRSP